MGKSRLEAFSDGVIAVIITIMVLELKVPHEESLRALYELWPVFLSYVMSFIYVALYWNNHHHMFQAVSRITGSVLWVNAHLLFWLSLIPFATAWMAENHFGELPVALYGVVLLCTGIAYTLLANCLVATQDDESALERARGKRDMKEYISAGLYLVAIALAFFARWASLLIYAAVAAMWLVPDRRIEKVVLEEGGTAD